MKRQAVRYLVTIAFGTLAFGFMAASVRNARMGLDPGWDAFVTLALLCLLCVVWARRERSFAAATLRRLDHESALRQEQRVTERELAHDRFIDTLDKMHAGCQIISPEWRYIYVNEAVAKQARRPKEELLGRTMMECYPGIEDTNLFGVLRRCMNDHVHCLMENEFVHPDGGGWFELSIQPVPEGILIVSIEVTERKRAEIGLQRSHLDLQSAYETTIEGWSRALDLRDKETEGHTQRVTELTVKLARRAGMSEAEILHVRRGALLHDIGKMGVPDHILLKPGPLTDEEWVAMRKHPTFAYELLKPIEYLRDALDIPYCHHEKWDGSGYPRGLKGEQIPLAARLFAVVDVWDAIRADRPYRHGWDEARALEYIRSISGTHLDPRAVELFMRVVAEEPKPAEPVSVR